MSNETYEGWKNTETHSVWLFINNDSRAYHSIYDETGATSDLDPEPAHVRIAKAKRVIKQYTWHVFNDANTDGLVTEAINCFNSQVDYDEIAKAWVDTLD